MNYALALKGVDFAIVYTAGLAIRKGASLYDGHAMRALAVAHVGPFMSRGYFRTPFTGFSHLQPDAVVNVPFTYQSYWDALRTFRRVEGILFAVSVIITGFALPRASRRLGWVLGALALLMFSSVAYSVGVGQNDASVMVALAVSIWGCARKRWWLVGVGLGVATVLKIIPVIIIGYLLLRGRRQAVLGAALTVIALLMVGVIVGNRGDLIRWVHHVLPSVSRGTTYLENQSIPAFFARSFGTQSVFDYSIGIGTLYRYGGLFLEGALVGVVAWVRRRQPVEPLELGFILLVGLCFWPVVWDHYGAWAILALILFADRRHWRGVAGAWQGFAAAAITAGAALMVLPTQYSPSNAIADYSLIPQITTGHLTIALTLWLFAAGVLLLWPQLSATPNHGESARHEQTAELAANTRHRRLWVAGIHRRFRVGEAFASRGLLLTTVIAVVAVIGIAACTIGDFRYLTTGKPNPRREPVVGQVKALGPNPISITITQPNGKDLPIYTAGATVIENATHGTPDDITPGSTVLVQGTPSDEGINANDGEVLVVPPGSKFGTTDGDIGQVKAVDQDSVTITRPGSANLTIHTTTTTIIDKATPGTPDDITPGSTVLVAGKLTYVGIDATNGEVLVLPPGSKFGTTHPQ
jgi:alpha-1,2-mannosyltransferase